VAGLCVEKGVYMRIALIWCGLVLAALFGGCVAASATSPAPLTDKDIRISLELGQQDKQGFPQAFRVTFENKSDHEGILAPPMPILSQSLLVVPPIPPLLILFFRAPDGGGAAFMYAEVAMNETEAGETEVLSPGQRWVHEYPAAQFQELTREMRPSGSNLPERLSAGGTEVKVHGIFLMGSAEDRPEQDIGVESEPIVMRCSFPEGLLQKEQAPAAPSGTPFP